MNGNWNGGNAPFIGATKKITKGEEMKLNQKELNLTKCKSR